jgi:hypothetical protein
LEFAILVAVIAPEQLILESAIVIEAPEDVFHPPEKVFSLAVNTWQNSLKLIQLPPIPDYYFVSGDCFSDTEFFRINTGGS